jgi:proteasome assembly chaperone 3
MHSSIPTDPSNALLPGTHITATTILGGTVPGLDTLGQTVLGLGLDRKMERVNSEEFADLVGLALDVL